jgi:cytochrome c-type biogenesis protein CcmH/NrfG
MTEANQNAKTSWTAVQVYALSLMCLLIGVTVGYLFRGARAPQASSNSKVAGSERSAVDLSKQPSPDHMKQMAEKQVAPLLEQLKAQPNDNDTVIKVAAYYFAARQFDESAKYFERSASLKPTADVLTRLANAYFYGGAQDKAISTLNRALQLDPKNANALYNLGMLKWQSEGDVKGAIECWQKLLKTNPNHPNRAQVEKMIALVKQHKEMPAGSKTNAPAM